MTIPSVLIIGGGPAGLIAAEHLSTDFNVTICDAMPSFGRKFLMAGVGGMNITHSEDFDQFVSRYREATPWLLPCLQRYGPEQIRQWMLGLGIESFVGSSGRVFPVEMKAAPLLRRWLHRLRESGVQFHVRHRWNGMVENGEWFFDTPEGQRAFRADAILLGLGGGSWSQLGSDGAWMNWLHERGITTSSLQPSNVGFNVEWSEFFKNKWAGQPLKPVALRLDNSDAAMAIQGECLITEYGIEGTTIYALSADLRDRLHRQAVVTLYIDLLPQWTFEKIIQQLNKPRNGKSWSSVFQSKLGLHGVRASLLRECTEPSLFDNVERLAKTIKAVPLQLNGMQDISDAISTAGGVPSREFDEHLMLRQWPGVFCSGEMLDWEAPTGGYLLTGCFATGVAAASGIRHYLKNKSR